jgi:uncharacterized protein (DUF2237 family)
MTGGSRQSRFDRLCAPSRQGKACKGRGLRQAVGSLAGSWLVTLAVGVGVLSVPVQGAAAQPAKAVPSGQRNVLGGPLLPCNTRLYAGHSRSGFCTVSAQDAGVHGVCAVMDRRFLDEIRAQGNDLITPNPATGFVGLKPGDRWCVCAGRWQQALDAGVAPRVVLSAMSRAVLDSLFLDDLTRHAVDPPRQSSSSHAP